MELTNEFRVDVPVDQAWEILTDVERIAPCMPGAQLQEIEGDEFRGIVKVKVGPITAQYKGVARFLEKDDDAKKAVLKAEGRDTRGQGNANATITATLTPDGTGTAVSVVTDLTVTGKVAQFGRGVLADVSAKLLTQFSTCLADDLLKQPSPTVANGPDETAAPDPDPAPAAPPAPTAPTAPTPAPTPAAEAPAPPRVTPPTEGVRKIDSKAAQPVDLLDAAGVPAAKRAIPVVAGVLVILWFLRRRRSQ